MLNRCLVLTLATIFVLAVATTTSQPTQAQGGTFYVATTGNDSTGNGSAGQPWATITYALDNVPGCCSTASLAPRR